MIVLLSTAAPAAELRLVVVGDTGEDTPVARLVAADVLRATSAAAPGHVRVVSTGDLFYDRPPAELSTAGCGEVAAERYRQFYVDALPQPVLAVTGNHDVYPPGGDKAFSLATHACTEAAFRNMGWLTADQPLATRVVHLDTDHVRADVVLVDWRLLGTRDDERAAIAPAADLRDDATIRVGVSHYPLPNGLTSGKCKEFGWNRALPDTVPGVDLWLNGHSHHLEARTTRGVLDVTSGGGKDLDPLEACGKRRSFYRVMAGDPVPTGAAQGGYTLVDVDPDQFVVTPIACTLDAGCAPIPEGVVTCRGTRAHLRCAH